MDLQNDFKKNCNLICLLQDSDVEVLFESENSLVLFKKEMNTYFVSSTQCDEYEIVAQQIDVSRNSGICFQQSDLLKYIRCSEPFVCCNYVYENETINFELKSDLEIRVLDCNYFDFVVSNYHLVDNREYVWERLASGRIWGLFKENECCGFIGIHDEGSMGFLVVLDAYQNQGYGMYLEMFLINKILSEGKIPFAQVAMDNIASRALQKKLGLTTSSNPITWGKIESVSV